MDTEQEENKSVRDPEKNRARAKKYYDAHREQVRTYQSDYDRRPDAVARRNDRVAARRRVSPEELIRLREASDRHESQSYGTREETVCLECGWKGLRIGSHLSDCIVPQMAAEYCQKWQLDRNALTSPALKKRIAASRTGKRIGAQLSRRRVSDAKILEIVALDLSVAESAKLAGISPMGFHKRAVKLGATFSGYQERRKAVSAYISHFGKWVKSQAVVPTIQRATDWQTERVVEGDAVCRNFVQYFPYLAAEIRDTPDTIQKLTEAKDTKIVISLTARLLKRARRSAVVPQKGPRKHGPDKTTYQQTESYKTGNEVQRLIDSGVKQSEARHAVAVSTHRQYSSVELYHKEFRSWLKKNP